MIASILALLIQVVPQAPAAVTLPVVPDEEATAYVGSCRGRGRSFDLRQVWFLENRQVDINKPDGPLRVAVAGDNLSFEKAGTTQTWNIGKMFAQGNQRPDVQLKLGVLEYELVVYWKETFQNRTFRQGLLKVGREPVSLCEGTGGLNVE